MVGTVPLEEVSAALHYTGELGISDVNLVGIDSECVECLKTGEVNRFRIGRSGSRAVILLNGGRFNLNRAVIVVGGTGNENLVAYSDSRFIIGIYVNGSGSIPKNITFLVNRHHSSLCLHERAFLSGDYLSDCGCRSLRLTFVLYRHGQNIAEVGIVAAGEIAVNRDYVSCKVSKSERLERIGDGALNSSAVN